MSFEFLALFWYMLIGFMILTYILLDGYDLGIGILSIFFRDTYTKDIMITTILPVWDGNGTWLVFGGASLYGAFPLAFSNIMPAVYAPVLIMVVFLLLRGIALEFRLKAEKTKFIWDFLFFLGSLVATICQALILSAIISGFVPGSNNVTVKAWLNPLVYAAVPGLILGYMLLGSNRLISKTTMPLQEHFFKASKKIQYLLLILMGFAAPLSQMVDSSLIDIWWHSKLSKYILLGALINLSVYFLHINALNKRHERSPFVYSVIIFAISFIGLVISTYPFLVPRQITYLQAASPKSSLEFIFIGASICLPMLIAYTSYAYFTFRGKIKEPIGY